MPDVPSLVAPQDRAFEVSDALELQWNHAAHAERFHVQVATDPAFASPIVDEHELTSISYVLTDLRIGTMYYWRVRAYSPSGAGEWSQVRSFKPASQVAVPGVPTLVAPSPNAQNQPTEIFFEWDPIPGASTYHIQVSLEDDFLRRSADLDGVRGTGTQIRELVPTYVYFWRVRAVNPLGYSEWSSTRRLVVLDESDRAPI